MLEVPHGLIFYVLAVGGLFGILIIIMLWNDYAVPNLFKTGSQIEKYRILGSVLSQKEFKRYGDQYIEVKDHGGGHVEKLDFHRPYKAPIDLYQRNKL